jgi:hypothetical protein
MENIVFHRGGGYVAKREVEEMHGTVFGVVRIGLGCKQMQRLLFLSSSQPLPFVLWFN